MVRKHGRHDPVLMVKMEWGEGGTHGKDGK